MHAALRTVPPLLAAAPLLFGLSAEVAWAQPAEEAGDPSEDADAEADEDAEEEDYDWSDQPIVVDAGPTAAPSPDQAQPVAEATPPEPIVVNAQGTRRTPRPTSGSDYRIDVGQLADVPRNDAEQMLTLAPGVFLSDGYGEGHPSTIYLRGFDSGEGQDIAFSLEGVPLNQPSHAHGHGFADTLIIIPELVTHLRFIEGPFDPEQGDFAVAGSANYELAMPRRGVTAKLGYGSFDTRRALLMWGPASQTDRTFAAVSYTQGDGFGPNRAHRSVRFNGQYEHPVDADTSVVALATAYASRYDSAGVIRLDDYNHNDLSECGNSQDEQFYCYYDDNQGGSAQHVLAAIGIEHDTFEEAIDNQLFVQVSSRRFRQNFTGYITDFDQNGDPQRGDGTEQVHESTTIGMRGRYALRADWWKHRQEGEVGYFVRHDRGQATQRRLRTSDGAPYRSVFDNELAITNVASYLAGKLRPFSWLTMRGGVRLDAFVFAVEKLDEPEIDRDGERLPTSNLEAFGFAAQPRGTVELLPAPWTSVFFSLGRGTRSSDAQALSDGEFAPFVEVTAAETGMVVYDREQGHHDHEARIVGFYTRVSNDLVFDEIQGRNSPIGASNRFGATLSGRLRHQPAGLDTAASVAYTEAYLPPDDAGVFDWAAGPRLAFIPRWVVRVDSALRRATDVLGPTIRYRLATGLSFIDGPPLPFNQFGSSIGMVDMRAGVGWRWFDLDVDVTNLLDRRNQITQLNYPSNFDNPQAPASQLPARHFAAGPPRQVMVSLTAHFGPDTAATNPAMSNTEREELN